ncbi:MAG TPA: hypothetical protein VFQ53_09005 [Kofleriaceae bacterium]|nr:hypothetical protein [Kofleriaceae bacterium]
MPRDPRDDFAAFADAEHLFHGLDDPYGLIREEVERVLAAENPDTAVERIATTGAPRWRTAVHRVPGTDRLVVTAFGFCVRARIAVTIGYAHEDIDAALTFLFAHIDDPSGAHCRTHFDLHAAAAAGDDDSVLDARFLAFRDAGP